MQEKYGDLRKHWIDNLRKAISDMQYADRR